ncbi:specifically androgen-regulated gene protein-like [Megalops cyprinoides]|uniref:specifically androgen-regulated gene protein-like n=1 Tax=Megalops cyprinoides TaxID=118141 RepID=UPI0018644219|nr:specifically androgen-regulated gene protein-like [Megalops cyprinoides]
MPKSEAWPGGVTMETVASVDSAGSCESMVSISSGCSDDSLDQLSAEERACLMFLEETIESLELEEDSGLSNDEPDLLPRPGSLAAKMADLSSSLGRSRLDFIKNHPQSVPMRDGGGEGRPLQGYLVPTPLVLASGREKGRGDPPSVPAEVSVVVLSPPAPSGDTPSEQRGHLGGQGGQGSRSATPRGPLSYEGLLQLRSCVSQRKANQSASETTDSPKPDTPHRSPVPHETPKPKASPPAVAPKPRKVPASVLLSAHKAPVPDSGVTCLGTSPTERGVGDPQRVRREALRKLGLLQDKEDVSGPARGTAPAPPMSLPPAPPTPPLQNPSCSQGRPRSQSHLPDPPAALPARSLTLERSDVGLRSGSHTPHSLQLRPRSRTTSLGDGKDVKEAPLIPRHPNGVSQVRQEALRKLGLLRD